MRRPRANADNLINEARYTLRTFVRDLKEEGVLNMEIEAEGSLLEALVKLIPSVPDDFELPQGKINIRIPLPKKWCDRDG